ncbi:hypothetical protein Droror1_Dr00018103 [Drosera rotundifolia]
MHVATTSLLVIGATGKSGDPLWEFDASSRSEEEEKVYSWFRVRYMWDVYTNRGRIRLPKFWQEAFEAVYEDMTSDVPGVREAAITEIAKMSIWSVELDPPPVQLTVCSYVFFGLLLRFYHLVSILD